MLEHSKKEINLQNTIEENILAIYLEEEPINYIPEKDSGYTLDLAKSSCTNGVEVSFDYNTWSVKTNYSNYTYQNNERVKCSLYFKKRTFAEAVVDCGALSKDAGICIKENYYLTDEVVEDETSDNNLRFIGANPNNYVWFNDELWRIIGVMNNIDDGTGKKETRLKIMRNSSYATTAWNATNINDWSSSTLKNTLNNTFYSSINSVYRNYIGQAVWYLGGTSTIEDVTTAMFYERERGTTVYNGRPTAWVGTIGLMYPSDYGYSTSGGSTTNRDACLKKPLRIWAIDDCCSNSWIYDRNYYKWTITSYAGDAVNVWDLTVNGAMYLSGAVGTVPSVFPNVYLKSSIKIISGDGSSSNPYHLSL